MTLFITTTGDILQAKADALVNPVNCVGVMGAGLAKQFKERWPAMCEDYRKACDYTFGLGNLHVWVDPETDQGIINLPTKNHWRDAADLEAIKASLLQLRQFIGHVNTVNLKPIHTIAIPALGCGLGGLDWDDVRPEIVNALSYIPDLDVYLHEPR